MVYFASDFHLGAPNNESSRIREDKICRWLDSIKEDATEIYLLGDLFDFWFEYKSVVPRGYVRFLGKLAELLDKGIDIHICVGNHDLWLRDYLVNEIGVSIFNQPQTIVRNGKKFHIHHGDGLGPGDKGYKVLKRFFVHPISQFIFSQLHPNLGFGIAQRASKKSRINQPQSEKEYQGDTKEFLTLYSEQILKKEEDIDFFVFGHRHLQLDVTLSNNRSRYINLGEWFTGSRYVRFDGEELSILNFEG